MLNKKRIVKVVGILLLLLQGVVHSDPTGTHLSANNDLIFSVELNIYFPNENEVSDPIYENFSSVILLDYYSAVLRIAVSKSAVDYEFIDIRTNHGHELNYTLDSLGRSKIEMYAINDYQVIELYVNSKESSMFSDKSQITNSNDNEISLFFPTLLVFVLFIVLVFSRFNIKI